ncbi:MAG TPA: hypothetical protein VML50_00110 [Anaeromyxobacter sp.]|nr:hypothetical protein [Anaeromyxobacter sp.]
MRVRLAQSLAVLVGIASGCATAHRTTGGPEAPVQLQVPEVLAWEPEGPFDIHMAVSNGTPMTLQIVQAKPEAAEVTVYRLDGKVACQTARAMRKTYQVYYVEKLQPGRHMELALDLHRDCARLEPGVYRYEANYIANAAEGVPSSLYQATLGPQGGKVLVKRGATSMKYEELLAAVEHPEAFEALVAADAAAAASAADAAGADASAAEVRACVDAELRGRGLNAYGDPQGTKYQSPPVDEPSRILYVASRNPAIRKACNIPVF